MRHLKTEQIGCDIYYPVPLHLQECLANDRHFEGEFPVSEEACQDVLALPLYPELTAAQQERVIDCCAAFLRQRTRRAA
jgi:dTDP-4-amino-4,6-dideoxygalactose transaminase